MSYDHINVPASGRIATDRILDAMEWLEGMYGPDTTDDYVATCEALIAELQTRIANATAPDVGADDDERSNGPRA